MLKQHIIEQRLELAFEESGILNEIMELFYGFNFQARFEEFKAEQTRLQSVIKDLNDKINYLVEDMTKIQIKFVFYL